MRRRVGSIAITAAAVLLAAAAHAPRGTVRGAVLFDDEFMPGVAVTLDDRTTVTTDHLGNFSFDDVAPGPHRVCAGDEKWMRTCRDVEANRFAELRVTPSAPAPCPGFTTIRPCPPPCDAGQFLTRHTNDRAKALAYYAKLDPRGKRKTLADWIRLARFEELAPPVRASYLNDNDLGFGRDMYMVKSGWGTFAWVSNFAAGCKLQDPRNADLAARGDPNDVIATVCMEFASQRYHGEGTDPDARNDQKIVKFLVFDHEGKLVPDALLDTFTPGFVPGLCVNCHGGTDFSGRRLDLQANFLPFDPGTFRFPAAGPDYVALRKLNDLVKETLSPDAKAVRELLDGWYPDDRVVPRLDWRPGGWTGTEKLYDGFIARACRTCHVAFPVNQFTTFQELAEARDTIIGRVESGEMPHAQITYMNFHHQNDLWPDTAARESFLCFRNHQGIPELRACLQRIP